MIKRIKPDLTHAFVLLSLIILGAMLIEPVRNWFFWYGRPTFQIEIIILISLLYIVLSVGHHYFDKSLTWQAALEYILVALLVIVVIAGAS